MVKSATNYRLLFDLSGRTAIVTGGAGILGSQFCHALASHGAQVAVVDIRAAEAKSLAHELQAQYGSQAIGVACDLTQPDSVKIMLEEVLLRFGQVNILHNNAAGKSDDLKAFFANFEDYSLEEWQKIMQLNLDSMFLVAQAVGGQMKKQGQGGSIIQTASIYGIMAPDHRIYAGSFYLDTEINTPAVYAASKGGVVALTKYLATYWAKDGIRVNTLTPGGVESGQNETFIKNYSARVPLGRMAQPQEMAGALLYLASNASGYVTGQNLVVDGGLSAW